MFQECNINNKIKLLNLNNNKTDYNSNNYFRKIIKMVMCWISKVKNINNEIINNNYKYIIKLNNLNINFKLISQFIFKKLKI